MPTEALPHPHPMTLTRSIRTVVALLALSVPAACGDSTGSGGSDIVIEVPNIEYLPGAVPTVTLRNNGDELFTLDYCEVGLQHREGAQWHAVELQSGDCNLAAAAVQPGGSILFAIVIPATVVSGTYRVSVGAGPTYYSNAVQVVAP